MEEVKEAFKKCGIKKIKDRARVYHGLFAAAGKTLDDAIAFKKSVALWMKCPSNYCEEQHYGDLYNKKPSKKTKDHVARILRAHAEDPWVVALVNTGTLVSIEQLKSHFSVEEEKEAEGVNDVSVSEGVEEDEGDSEDEEDDEDDEDDEDEDVDKDAKADVRKRGRSPKRGAAPATKSPKKVHRAEEEEKEDKVVPKVTPGRIAKKRVPRKFPIASAPNTSKRTVSDVSGDESRVDKAVNLRKKRSPDRKKEEQIKIGGVYEGENDYAPFYNDLVQRVKITGREGKMYVGHILGLPKDKCKWSRDKLHRIRSDQGDGDWNVGDNVQFLMKERYGLDDEGNQFQIEDGGQIEKKFLWCKGKIIKIRGEMYMIQHSAWDKRDPTAMDDTQVAKKLIRSSY